MSTAPDQTPFSTLDPDSVLDAVESLGFECDGRLLALNSYENRVYQVGLESAAPLVAKFYRPDRWSDEAILAPAADEKTKKQVYRSGDASGSHGPLPNPPYNGPQALRAEEDIRSRPRIASGCTTRRGELLA